MRVGEVRVRVGEVRVRVGEVRAAHGSPLNNHLTTAPEQCTHLSLLPSSLPSLTQNPFISALIWCSVGIALASALFYYINRGG